MTQLWPDKFFPKDLSEFIGNKDVVESVRVWGEQWTEGKQGKPLLFFGATGSGKTYVMAMAIVWSYFNKRNNEDIELTKNFLILTYQTTVYERLKKDFGNGQIFRDLPLIPEEWLNDWHVQIILKDDTALETQESVIYLTNIEQLYERENKFDDDFVEDDIPF